MRHTLLVLVTFLLLLTTVYAQKKDSYLQADYFYGNIISSTPDEAVLLQGHPSGIFLSYNIKNYGQEAWHERYNYPDAGISFGYQDFHSDILEQVYAIYGHYNFYFTKRLHPNQIILRTGIGVAYATNPYDKVTNNKNTAFGSHLNSSTYFKLYYQRENLLKNLGLTAGLSFIHTSNSNIKSPNSGANVWAANVGLTYNLSPSDEAPTLIPSTESSYYKEPIKFNFSIRGGVNESSIIGTGVKPFFVFSAHADKRLNRVSAIQLGTDVYISPIYKDFYDVNKSIPHSDYGDVDEFTRVGIFIGHELFMGDLSIEGQIGYYAYAQYEYDGPVYETLGLKRYFGDKWYASVRLKAHAANAETVEFGVGIRI